MGIWSPSPGTPPSLLVFTDVSRTGWGEHLQDLTSAGVWAEKELSPYQYLGDEWSLTSFEHLQRLDQGRVCIPDE